MSRICVVEKMILGGREEIAPVFSLQLSVMSVVEGCRFENLHFKRRAPRRVLL